MSRLISSLALSTCFLAPCLAADWPLPPTTLPAALKHPCLAATPQELQRLRAAFAQTGPAHDAVARLIRDADRALAAPVHFPPRGGQHNQWYQCEPCQMGLKTVDDSHHQCPKCKKIYTGEPYDDVIFGHRHGQNLNAAHAAAWAYAITGKKAYADFAATILLGYAERYRAYPYHSADGKTGPKASRSGGYLFEQTLNEASALATPHRPRLRPHLRHSFRRPAGQTPRRPAPAHAPKPRQAQGRHGATGKPGTTPPWSGAPHWSTMPPGSAKPSPTPKNGFVYQMQTSVSAEGMWYENSWGYHFYTLQAIVATAEGSPPPRHRSLVPSHAQAHVYAPRALHHGRRLPPAFWR